MTGFVLDPRIAANSAPMLSWSLSEVRLMNERRYPWLLLVPQRQDIADLADLSAEDAATLMVEARACVTGLLRLPGIAKTNVATLGNAVRQMHVHVIGRAPGDASWPGVPWDKGPFEPMPAADLAERMETLRALLSA